MFSIPIILWSPLCKSSVKFIKKLEKHHNVIENCIIIDISAVNGKRPQAYLDIQSALNNFIKAVPTVVTENAEYVLTGKEECVNWLESQVDSCKIEPPEKQEGFSDVKYGVDGRPESLVQIDCSKSGANEDVQAMAKALEEQRREERAAIEGRKYSPKDDNPGGFLSGVASDGNFSSFKPM